MATQPDVIRVDDRHLIVPRNTEYEIFTVAGKSQATAIDHR